MVIAKACSMPNVRKGTHDECQSDLNGRNALRVGRVNITAMSPLVTHRPPCVDMCKGRRVGCSQKVFHAKTRKVLRFRLFSILHKQHYYWTASFLYLDPTSPRTYSFSSTISPRRDSWYKDLLHCTFPSVIQGPLSLYDYIGILYDTIYPHTPTSSTIHIGLAYVGPDRSSI